MMRGGYTLIVTATVTVTVTAAATVNVTAAATMTVTVAYGVWIYYEIVDEHLHYGRTEDDLVLRYSTA